MGRYLLLAVLTAGLGICGVRALAANPAAPAPAAATAIHPLSATAATAAEPTAAEAQAATSATHSASMPAQADTGPSMPVRGMSMANVEHIFGAPQEKLPAVPDPGTKLHPPITRWVYPDYVVYFEYNYVVHTVLKNHPFADGGHSGS
jgi:hypothetical protein